MVVAFLPNNLHQNAEKYSVFHPHWSNKWTLFYSVFYPCWSNSSSLLAKQLASKHCRLQCFLHMLKQWLKLSCRSKTLKIAVFSTHVEAMAQAFLPHIVVQNTVNYCVFYTCWSNSSSLLAKQLASKRCRLLCFLHMLKQWFKPCLLFVVCCLLFVVCCCGCCWLLFVVCCLLVVVCCLFLFRVSGLGPKGVWSPWRGRWRLGLKG